MAFDQYLADRISSFFKAKNLSVEEKNMMGGLCYMLDDKMCVGIVKDELMVRVGLEVYESCLQKPGCKEMNFTGRSMKGYVYVESSALDTDEELAGWLQLAVDFNPFAKSSKKKKSKS